MTAVNNINYYRTNIHRSGRSDSGIAMAAKALGADEYTFAALVRRLCELREVKVPTVVEINGIENSYTTNKADVDRLFAFLALFSKKHKLVKFAVMVGNMRYML